MNLQEVSNSDYETLDSWNEKTRAIRIAPLTSCAPFSLNINSTRNKQTIIFTYVCMSNIKSLCEVIDKNSEEVRRQTRDSDNEARGTSSQHPLTLPAS